MNKYKVILAVYMPFNFEIEVKAKNPDEAVGIAADSFTEDSTLGRLIEIDAPMELTDGYEISAEVTEIK